uniref:EGF-like domain-containing protein n=1 Tax=Magallana gigas TaxID=29159 RepID=A0A8W8NXK6_MAGGI
MKMNSLIMILSLILTLTAEASNQEKGNNGFGHICEKNNPCENGGVCGYTRGGYICKCQKGWEGDNCSGDVVNWWTQWRQWTMIQGSMVMGGDRRIRA